KTPKIIDSLYIHFPFCAHLCNYCDFYKKVPTDKVKDFHNFHHYLEESFSHHQNLIEKHGYSWAPLKTLYIGGGTPSMWGVEGSKFLENFFKKHQIQLANDYEFTLEVNPGGWNEEVLTAWQKLGANRFSLGVQALNGEMIKYLDRTHTIEDVHETLQYFHDHQLNFSVDFMLGLPFSEKFKRDVIEELSSALRYKPSHFSVYILTVKDNYKYFNDLPDEEWIEDEFLKVSDFLSQKGFLHYEVSNFALPKKQSAHNLNYWKSHTVAALGPSATGFLSEEKLRYKWMPLKPEMVFEELTEEEFKLEKIYMSIRSQEGIRLTDFPEKLTTKVLEWKQKKLVTENAGVVTLTSRGYLLLDSLMSDLFSLKLL
ncbi:MAG: coproporphyrinogen III oxidase family protein, partial [Bacteriovorax sp.]|nr:coproporphyrinogen III oxidase family protein [Bacteriovorax sp.]